MVNALDPQLAVLLREYPLCNFDRARVATRAYFLGETCGDSLKNWLDAEVLESFIQADAAIVLPKDALNFLREYELVDHIRFLTNEPRRKEFRGDRNSRSCSICGRVAPEVRFRTEAHLLPACTGNRYLYTAHECDDCNLTSGKQTEDELGKMLGPHRAMHQIQTRSKPSATHQLYDGGSSLGGQSRGEPLSLSVVEGGPTITTNDMGNNTLRVDVQSAPFRAIAALRSLGRTAWHLLPAELRGKYPGLLTWVLQDVGAPQLTYLDVMIPGPGLRHTTFAVWVRRSSRDEWPELIFALAMGSLILVVPFEARLWDALPCPPLPRSPYGEPQIRKIKVLRDQAESVKFNYEVKYLSKSLRAIPGGSAVRVEIVKETSVIGLNAVLETIPALQGPPKGGPVEYLISGNELCGELRVTYTPLHLHADGRIEGGQASTFYSLPDAGTPVDPAAAIATFAFLEAFVSGGTLRVTLEDARSVFADVALTPLENAPLDEIRHALGLS